MKRMIVLSCVWLGMAICTAAHGQDATGAPPAAPVPDQSLSEQLQAKPDDKALFDKYMIKNLGEVRGLLQSNPDAAEKQLAEMKVVINSLKPDTDAGKQLTDRAVRVIDAYGQQVALARTTLEELVAKLKEKTDDAKTIAMYQSKLMSKVSPLARSEPEKAEKILAEAKELLASFKESAKDDATKKALEKIEQSFASVEKRIETGKRLAALVGSQAAPLDVESWVNGEALTDGDLKGKVVLLVFWSVWCGPCIATFPHLREWHEQYADKGLVIIGLTRYYNYTWDNEAGRAKRAPSGEKVTPEQEQEMLVKFAENHNLHHRFAIQKDRGLSDFYAVTGIPHVVVIDREGQIRLVRVGSGEQNAKDIGSIIEKLVKAQ